MTLSTAKSVWCWWHEWISMVHLWNDADMGKQKYSKTKLTQCYSVHHKSHTCRSVREPGICSKARD